MVTSKLKVVVKSNIPVMISVLIVLFNQTMLLPAILMVKAHSDSHLKRFLANQKFIIDISYQND
jgi:hypothetical protein